MPQLTPEQIQRTVDACRAQLAEIGETFCVALDCQIRLAAGELVPYSPEAVAGEFAAPGLAVSLVIAEGQGLVLAVPESLILPAWYRQPNISENNRLQTLAHELSLKVLPANLQADRYAAIAVEDLREFVEGAQVNPSATVLELQVFAAAAAEEEGPVAKMFVVFPVDAPPIPPPAESVDAAASTTSGADTLGATDSHPFPSDGSGLESESAETIEGMDGQEIPSDELAALERAESMQMADQALRALRILPVPVTVSVRLAERRVPLGQVVALAPGALITFNKSCEELLDLFINNHRYCQGEAVKIGENFGLRIAKVGVTEERKEHVL